MDDFVSAARVMGCHFDFLRPRPWTRPFPLLRRVPPGSRSQSSHELLSDELLCKIMTTASYAAGGAETVGPSGRFACVSKRWNRVYRAHRGDFATNELRRIADQISIANDGNDGDTCVRTIVDSWREPGNWWYSGAFEGGAWSEDIIPIDAVAGPYWAIHAPTLVLRFGRRVTIRAVGMWARNKPRLIHCFIRRDSMDFISNRNMFGLGACSDRVSINPISQKAFYNLLVAEKMPQGRPAADISPEEAIRIQLPELLPEPLTIDEGEAFCIKILASQERGWVGINHLTLWE